MCPDIDVTLFKGKTIGFFVAKWPYTMLSSRILELDPGGNGCRWRCVISTWWISTCLRLGLKRTTIRPKGSIKIRPCLQVINEVFRVIFFHSLFPLYHLPDPAESSSNVLKSTIWKGKCCWTHPGCHTGFFFLSSRHTKTLWHFKMLHIWPELSPEHIHCLRLTKTLLFAYFIWLFICSAGCSCGTDSAIRLNWKTALHLREWKKREKTQTWWSRQK